MSEIRHFGGTFSFLMFFLILSVTILGKDLGLAALRSVHQDAFFELSKSTFREIFKLFSARGDPFDLRHPTEETRLFLKYLGKMLFKNSLSDTLALA